MVKELVKVEWQVLAGYGLCIGRHCCNCNYMQVD